MHQHAKNGTKEWKQQPEKGLERCEKFWHVVRRPSPRNVLLVILPSQIFCWQPLQSLVNFHSHILFRPLHSLVVFPTLFAVTGSRTRIRSLCDVTSFNVLVLETNLVEQPRRILSLSVPLSTHPKHLCIPLDLGRDQGQHSISSSFHIAGTTRSPPPRRVKYLPATHVHRLPPQNTQTHTHTHTHTRIHINTYRRWNLESNSKHSAQHYRAAFLFPPCLLSTSATRDSLI